MTGHQSHFSLGQIALKAGYSVSGHKTVASTNAEALRAARDTQADRLWIVASEQTQGRGRRGRNWISPPGNLAASLIIRLPSGTPNTPLLGFVAGVSLIRAILPLMPDGAPMPKLKWPNDVLSNNAKLAGILLEAELAGSGELHIVIGMGINVKTAPRHGDELKTYASISLSKMGIQLSAYSFFAKLSDSWVDCFEMWNSKQGRTALLAEWRANAAGIGQPIRVNRPNGEVSGTFETIDEQGQLIINTGRRVAIAAGDIYF